VVVAVVVVVVVLVLVLPLALALALALLALRVVVREMIQNHLLTKGLQREEAVQAEGNGAWHQLQIIW
jgi:hypothetical protein